MSSSKWSTANVLKFLDIYRKHECLWNPKDENYKYQINKEAALQDIVDELNIPDMTQHDVKLKIKSIRTAYKRELTTVLKTEKRDGNEYIPKLFWFKYADAFLRPVSMRRRTYGTRTRNLQRKIMPTNYKIDSNILQTAYRKLIENTKGEYGDTFESVEIQEQDENTMYDENDEVSQDNHSHEVIIEKNVKSSPDALVTELEENEIDLEIETVTTGPCTTPNHHEIETTEHEFIHHHQDIEYDQNSNNDQMNKEVIQSVNVPSQSFNMDDDRISVRLIDEDENFSFGRSVAAQLKSISDSYSRSLAKFKIQQILFEAETGRYKK